MRKRKYSISYIILDPFVFMFFVVVVVVVSGQNI